MTSTASFAVAIPASIRSAWVSCSSCVVVTCLGRYRNRPPATTRVPPRPGGQPRLAAGARASGGKGARARASLGGWFSLWFLPQVQLQVSSAGGESGCEDHDGVEGE